MSNTFTYKVAWKHEKDGSYQVTGDFMSCNFVYDSLATTGFTKDKGWDLTFVKLNSYRPTNLSTSIDKFIKD